MSEQQQSDTLLSDSLRLSANAVEGVEKHPLRRATRTMRRLCSELGAEPDELRALLGRGAH